jgi:hypothetical protein
MSEQLCIHCKRKPVKIKKTGITVDSFVNTAIKKIIAQNVEQLKKEL